MVSLLEYIDDEEVKNMLVGAFSSIFSENGRLKTG